MCIFLLFKLDIPYLIYRLLIKLTLLLKKKLKHFAFQL